MLKYSARDWYWIDGKGAIYGSARGGLVRNPSNDTSYQLFLASGTKPTPDRSDDFAGGIATNLDEVLAAAGQPFTGFTLDNTKAAAIDAATKACIALQEAMAPNVVHRAALAAAAVVASHGEAPAPATLLGAKCSALASQLGMSADAFMSLAASVTGANFDLSNALSAFENAVTSAADKAAIAAALSTFEQALSAVAAEINAAKPIATVSTTRMSVKGVNT